MKKKTMKNANKKINIETKKKQNIHMRAKKV